MFARNKERTTTIIIKLSCNLQTDEVTLAAMSCSNTMVVGFESDYYADGDTGFSANWTQIGLSVVIQNVQYYQYSTDDNIKTLGQQ